MCTNFHSGDSLNVLHVHWLQEGLWHSVRLSSANQDQGTLYPRTCTQVASSLFGRYNTKFRELRRALWSCKGFKWHPLGKCTLAPSIYVRDQPGYFVFATTLSFLQTTLICSKAANSRLLTSHYGRPWQLVGPVMNLVAVFPPYQTQCSVQLV